MCRKNRAFIVGLRNIFNCIGHVLCLKLIKQAMSDLAVKFRFQLGDFFIVLLIGVLRFFFIVRKSSVMACTFSASFFAFFGVTFIASPLSIALYLAGERRGFYRKLIHHHSDL